VVLQQAVFVTTCAEEHWLSVRNANTTNTCTVYTVEQRNRAGWVSRTT